MTNWLLISYQLAAYLVKASGKGQGDTGGGHRGHHGEWWIRKLQHPGSQLGSRCWLPVFGGRT